MKIVGVVILIVFLGLCSFALAGDCDDAVKDEWYKYCEDLTRIDCDDTDDARNFPGNMTRMVEIMKEKVCCPYETACVCDWSDIALAQVASGVELDKVVKCEMQPNKLATYGSIVAVGAAGTLICYPCISIFVTVLVVLVVLCLCPCYLIWTCVCIPVWGWLAIVIFGAVILQTDGDDAKCENCPYSLN